MLFENMSTLVLDLWLTRTHRIESICYEKFIYFAKVILHDVLGRAALLSGALHFKCSRILCTKYNLDDTIQRIQTSLNIIFKLVTIRL